MGWKKVLFIYNPVSGRSLIKSYLADILQILSGADYTIECYPTRGKGDARRYARQLTEEYLYVVCAGGDGTLDEVVSGLMENPSVPPVPVGYIPLGTTNDFASSLGIPSDPLKAAQAIVSGRAYECDLGWFNHHEYFTYVAAFGAFTETSYGTPQELKNMLGHAAYILQGITELGNIRTYPMRVETEEESFEDNFVFGMISNSRSIGGIEGIQGKDVDLQDGLFEATLIRMPQNLPEINDLVQYLSGAVTENALVYHRKVRGITLTSPEKVRWTRDGEDGGAHRRVALTALQRRLKILVPPEIDTGREVIHAKDGEEEE